MGFIDESVRVMKLTRRPKKEEFWMISKVTGIGMIVIGIFGTIISIIARLIGLN